MMKIRRSETVLLVEAAAIILPVAALAGIALNFLGEDKNAIEQEARARAKAELPELSRVFNQLMKGHWQFNIDAAGEIKDGQALAVPDYPQQPEPWDSPAPAEATAEWRQLEAAEHAGGAPNLVPRAVSLAHRFPDAVTESGTPLAGLALLLAVRHVREGTFPRELVDELDRSVNKYPSFLAPEVLRAAGQAATDGWPASQVARIQRAWTEQEALREETRATVRRVAERLVGAAGPAAVRVARSRSGTDQLALCTPARDGWKITFLGDVFHTLTLIAKAMPPPYAGLAVAVDQEQWRARAGNSPSAVLASTAGLVDIPGGHRFRITLELADPELLYASYRRRVKVTAWLIFLSAAAALIGLASLWMGYRRQARLSEMKSNFVSSVSHELRAPLAAVRLMAESLDGGRVADQTKQRDYYRLIVQECRRLSSLVENVLDLSRINEGRKRYTFEAVDLAALVRQSVAVMEPCAAERQVSLRLGEMPGLQPIWDPQAVEQALVNLLDNAIKHSPPGETVQVAAELDSASGNIRLWVEDRGPGIPPREQKHIFEMFYRHGSELRRETKGAGIGLSIVQHVAEGHGGRVIVESEVGRGSRFGLELPLEHRS